MDCPALNGMGCIMGDASWRIALRRSTAIRGRYQARVGPGRVVPGQATATGRVHDGTGRLFTPYVARILQQMATPPGTCPTSMKAARSPDSGRRLGRGVVKLVEQPNLAAINRAKRRCRPWRLDYCVRNLGRVALGLSSNEPRLPPRNPPRPAPASAPLSTWLKSRPLPPIAATATPESFVRLYHLSFPPSQHPFHTAVRPSNLDRNQHARSP
ncbi:uncharacterized protein BDZ99DRAFT_150703 [Mytilinidion resinicola]|uniref:Uncharacterized protein n=1 Tax=Mytilinidion resinicola TaxID=574789 RepID=A0A6A6Y7W3_9PEZI|nr:uncharacterized protein BDZ99DRAFT_150703 [Mytilinidion resinicola]KAF2804699.1 hypothetical protein BDZ99DRAFT_150703 [Mytilinidion resinicola]